MATKIREQLSVTMKEAPELVMDIFKARLVPYLVSPPGVGKSALFKQLAEKYKLKLIDIRLSMCDPADLNGFPFLLKENGVEQEKIKAGYVPMNMWPIETDPLPYIYTKTKKEDGSIVFTKTDEQYKGWLILLDEFSSAPLSVQAAAYKVVHDKMVGMHNLHPKVLIGAASNSKEDKAIVNRIGTAMQSRLIWLHVRVCNQTWREWAIDNGIDHRVISFVHFQPDLLHNFDPDHQELTFPCPRTWEFMSKIVAPWQTIQMAKLPVLAGTVGEGAARQFYAYTQMFESIPTIEEILHDPENCHFGAEPGVHHAIMGLVAHHLKADNADILIKFLRRLDIDFQVIALKTAIRSDRGIMKTKEYNKWIAVNADELME